ncbi:outer membrane protein assembly factor BamC [Hydrogenophaga defluvii]|uniref:Outer membrane protein assembly factor BamC n=1 Tax=Hydrogenophaga defluvii TaxID=249410 RepID=A0ABW2SGZ7_9BURK
MPARRTASSFRPHHSTRLGVLALAASLATGCSVLETDKIDYKSAKRASTLEVPPDLTQINRESRYVVPGTSVTASGFQTTQTTAAAAAGTAVAAASLGDVRIERSGSQRWLVIKRPADQLWQPVVDFWQENGFLLTQDQQALGIMETDWAENRAKLPQDVIRSTLGKVFDSLYSTGERDRFRTRLERTADGGTEIYISHRGMIEVYANDRKDQTVWQPRPADPELETEFLRRLMVKLGVPQEQAKAQAASTTVPSAARATSLNGAPALEFDDNFDRAWRRVGLSLDRTGFTVEDRDRAQGLYFVRYVAPDPNTSKEPSFLGRLFGAGKPADATPVRYRILVRSVGDKTTVSVLDAQGQPDKSANAQRITQVLVDDLK